MRFRRLTLALCGLVTALGVVAPAFAYDDRRGQDRREWRQREWRDHQWREHDWREPQWRQQYWPPALAVRPYGNYAPPPVFYHNPTLYR
ncbi:hypothetical protein [Rhodopila sp.]|uniref:hypothetical protein n=1 Tax=Rhodopila sp. TaxID=2480087 RepID=UPI003D0CDE39